MSLAEIPTLDPAALQAEVDRHDAAPLLIDFWASWCGVCRMLKPAVARVAATQGDALRVAGVDVEAHPELAERWGVLGLPVLVLVDGGKEVLRINDFKGEAGLTESIVPHLHTEAAASGEGGS